MDQKELEEELIWNTARVYWLGAAIRAILATHPSPSAALQAWEQISSMGSVGWEQSAIARGIPGYRSDVLEASRREVDGLFRGVPGALQKT